MATGGGATTGATTFCAADSRRVRYSAKACSALPASPEPSVLRDLAPPDEQQAMIHACSPELRAADPRDHSHRLTIHFRARLSCRRGYSRADVSEASSDVESSCGVRWNSHSIRPNPDGRAVPVAHRSNFAVSVRHYSHAAASRCDHAKPSHAHSQSAADGSGDPHADASADRHPSSHRRDRGSSRSRGGSNKRRDKNRFRK